MLAQTTSYVSTFPERPIVFICPWPAGGTADAIMRALCSAATKVLENSAGASGMPGSVTINPLKDITYLARTSGQTFGLAVHAG